MWAWEREKKRRWEDVKMSRCEDEQMWRWADVKMSRCEDEQMWRWADVKMSRCEDEQSWRWADVKMSTCEDEQEWRWEGVKMRRCEDEQMWRWADVKMRRCEKVWEGVKMRRCEDEKMRYRPPLLEEPCAQTLSGTNKSSYQSTDWLLLDIFTNIYPQEWCKCRFSCAISSEVLIPRVPILVRRAYPLAACGTEDIFAGIPNRRWRSPNES